MSIEGLTTLGSGVMTEASKIARKYAHACVVSKIPCVSMWKPDRPAMLATGDTFFAQQGTTLVEPVKSSKTSSSNRALPYGANGVDRRAMLHGSSAREASIKGGAM